MRMPAAKGRPKNASVERATQIAEFRQSGGGKSLVFQAAPLTLASLPYRQPKAGTDVWVRRNGDFWLTLRPGVSMKPNGEHGSYGWPFGVIPRALLMWVTAEALRTQDPKIELGSSLSDFVVKLLGQRATSGPNGTRTRVKEQANRLFNADISYQWMGNGDRIQAGVNLKIARAWRLDLGDGEMGQESLFPSYVQLSGDFFEEIIKSPVPLDLEAVRLLGSAAAMDLYAFITYKAFVLNKTGKYFLLTWDGMGDQFGYQFPKTSKGRYKLKEKVLPAWESVRRVYPEANVTVTNDGLLLGPGPTAVQPRKSRGRLGSGATAWTGLPAN
ncbi:predicted protein [Streptomyces sp. AA4]|nr:predicted protein [Streptomyces sp. AA4]